MLVEELEPVIPLGRSNNGRSLLPKEKIMIFLCYSGSVESHLHVGDRLDCAEGTIKNCVNQVLEAFHAPNPRYNGKSFVQEHISLPNSDEAIERGKTFLGKQPFPKTFSSCIIAALDGMHAKASTVGPGPIYKWITNS